MLSKKINNERIMFVLERKELKKFDINRLMPGDQLVVIKKVKENRPLDYFISIDFDKAVVTTRYNLRKLCGYQMPQYVRWLVEDINTRLGYLRRSKFRVGDIVRRTDRKNAANEVVCNVIADENGNVFYVLENNKKFFPKKMISEDSLRAVVRNITPNPCANYRPN